jgi:hypothetical protein
VTAHQLSHVTLARTKMITEAIQKQIAAAHRCRRHCIALAVESAGPVSQCLLHASARTKGAADED